MPIFSSYLRCAAGPFVLATLAPAMLAADDAALAKFRREVQPTLEKYCYECHGDGAEKGGVKLDGFETADSLRDHALWLRALRNVRTHIMPPVDADPLPAAEAGKLMAWIKQDVFSIDPANPDPGRVTVRRLNRVEYRNTVRDLTGVDFDTQKEFPSDDTGHGFDNIADVLTISPMLLEKYLDAAQTIIGKAVVTQAKSVVEAPIYGRQFATIKVDTKVPEAAKPAAPADAAPAPAAAVPEVPAVAVTPPAPVEGAVVAANAATPPGALAAAGQRGAGAPGRGAFGARGARGAQGGRRGQAPLDPRPVPAVEADTIVLSYYTPATVAAKHKVTQAGKYQLAFDLLAQETYADNLFDLNKCKVVISLNGEKLLDQEFVREGYGKKYEFVFDRELPVGEHEISVEIQPLAPEMPHYRALRLRINSVTVRGPLAPEAWVKTPGYDKYFPREIPVAAAARRDYAKEILAKFSTRAFRRPVDAATLDRIVGAAERVYSQPANSFESGVAQAMVAVLASPSFLFREDRVESLKPGQTFPFVDEYALASRLSYFLWSSMPDDELLKLAGEGKLRAGLSAQVKRMLNDPRGQELIHNFTGQWLQARDIATVPITAEDVYLRDHPNPEYMEAREVSQRVAAIPRANQTPEDVAAAAKARTALFEFRGVTKPDLTPALRTAMLKETEMTFAYVLQEDRSLLELINSDYTFLNEDLAKHYGVEGVTGPEMRKVTLASDSPRGGILTQGTVLAVTSNPTRTSPVKRGVFILEAILGTPPAPPPPNIPPLEDAASAAELRVMNLRDTLALHAKNPTCSSCHSRMDPLGLALENFNAMGMWRTTDSGQPVQPAGKLITGETFTDIRGLKSVLASSHRQDFYYAISSKLLTYALGRGLDYYDVATLDQISAQLEATGGRPSALVLGIINSAPFQQRRPTATTAGEAAKPISPRLSQN